MKYFIKTFGCAMNVADSERIEGDLEAKGYKKVSLIEEAELVVVNTCMVRRSAEDRVYGLIRNLVRQKEKAGKPKKIILSGCMAGMAVRDVSGKWLGKLKELMPGVDEFLPIGEVGFDQIPVRSEVGHAWMPVSNGCDNFCSYCVVPFTRGREKSRPFGEILREVEELLRRGCEEITLLGQNVNSYGTDLVKLKFKSSGSKVKVCGKLVEPVMVRRMGKERIPTLFPFLLEAVASMKGVKKVDFISSNPWDFSDELIEVIARNVNISRKIHLPVQSGSDAVLRRMNRWYTRKEYMELVDRIRKGILGVELTTDVIVGFPGETEEEFEETVDLVERVKFRKAYIARYSPRPMTAAGKMEDDVTAAEKKRRWRKLENLINRNEE